MATIELELDERAVQELRREAAAFEFGDAQSYVEWLVEHRAVTLDGSAVQRQRTDELGRRVEELSGQVARLRNVVRGEETDGESDDARAGIDWMLLQTESADDDAVEAAIPTIDETLDDEMDL